MSSLKDLLLESSYVATGKKGTILSPANRPAFLEMLADNQKFKRYINVLSEGMNEKTKREFAILANNTRRIILEQSLMGNLSYYETFTFPVLSVFYPRLIARELVTTTPIDKPEVIKAFLRPKFRVYESDEWENAPSYNNVSSGPVPTGGSVVVDVPNNVDLLALAGMTPDQATIQRGSFAINRIYSGAGGTGNSAEVYIMTNVDGGFTANVAIGANSDIIHGSVDFKSGNLTISSVNGVVRSVRVTFVAGLEQNLVNTQMELTTEKIRLTARDRVLTAKWSLQFEQDVKQLFDVDFQSEVVAFMGQQIALDIDREIVGQLINVAGSLPQQHQDNFYLIRSDNFYGNDQLWYASCTTKLNKLAAAIYADTNIGFGNVIAINPNQAMVIESVNDFVYTYTGNYENGALGYHEATIVGGKFKVLVSPVIPDGKALVILKPAHETQVVYYYCPYVPALVYPYPMQNVPTISFMSRYATAMVRPSGVSVLTFVNDQEPNP